MFSRILVPTDFSAGSEKAWAVAQRMAANLGAELVLLHVLPGTPLDVEMLLASEERKAELRSLQAEHQLGIPRADDEDPPPARRVFEGPFTKEALRKFSPEGRAWAEMLEAWAVRARDAGAKVRTVLRVGVPYREVLSETKESHADLVLLATHGRGEIHRPRSAQPIMAEPFPACSPALARSDGSAGLAGATAGEKRDCDSRLRTQ